MKIIISPNDVLLFREAKTFDAGETHVARSILPVQQALAGAIRSKVLVNSDFSDDAKQVVGYKKEDPAFEIHGSFFHKQQDYFKAPLDIAKSKDEVGYFYIMPRELQWKKKDLALFVGKRLHFESVNGYLSHENMIKYLCGTLEEESLNLNNVVEGSEKLFKRENRVGIKLGSGKTTEEGYFYKVEFLRLNKGTKLSLWLGSGAADVEQRIGKRGILKLGGESRFAKYELKEEELLANFQKKWEGIKGAINRDKKFKLYIATPSLVKESETYTWDVERIIKEKLELEGVNIYPLVGKPYLISGWDYADNKPKGNKYGIPEGSVYFIKFDGEFNWDMPYFKFGELNKLGYGLAFLGVWNGDKGIGGDEEDV